MSNEDSRSRFLTPEEFARLHKVPVARVRRWLTEDRLPHVRVGSLVKIPSDALDRLLEDQSARRESEPRGGVPRDADGRGRRP